MATNTKWRDNGVVGRETSMNSYVALTPSGVNDLATAQLSPKFSEIIFGDYTKWCSSLIFFPYNIIGTSPQQYLRVSGIDLDVPCYYPNVNHIYGYTLGEYHYLPKFNDFRDYEPYTQLQIYLPFYGFTEVPIADVMNKYIQFRLSVDFMTGQAMYTIGVSTNSITSPNAPFYIGTDDSNTIILSTLTFNLGVVVPLGQTGMAETIRNISLGIVKGAAAVGANYLIAGTGLSKTTSSTHQVTKIRNPATRRMVPLVSVDSSKTYDNSNYFKARAVSGCMETAVDTLGNMSLKPNTDKANNPFVDNQGSKSIQIVRRYAKVVEVTESYNNLYGKPLGETRLLSTLSGYTEVTAIHFEGNGFASITNSEIAMLEEAFADGVILP